MNMGTIDKLYEEASTAKEELDQAWQNFNYASKDMVDSAVLDLKAKQEKYMCLVRKLKNEVFQ